MVSAGIVPSSARPPSGTSDRRRAIRRVGAVAIGALVSFGAIDVSGAMTVGAAESASPARQASNVDVAPQPGGQPEATTQQNVFTQVNANRRANGARDVRYNYAVTVAAQRHANDMAARNRMTHTGSDGSNAGQRITRAGFRWTSWGENVAVGQTSSAAVVGAWMRSAGHRANLLNPRFQWMGVGLAYGNGRIWWCVVMASG